MEGLAWLRVGCAEKESNFLATLCMCEGFCAAVFLEWTQGLAAFRATAVDNSGVQPTLGQNRWCRAPYSPSLFTRAPYHAIKEYTLIMHYYA